LTKGVVLRRSFFLVVATVLVLSPLLSPEASSSESLVFAVETVVPENGGPPSIAVDATARRWIGYAAGNTMQFGVRDEGGWSFETVPFSASGRTTTRDTSLSPTGPGPRGLNLTCPRFCDHIPS
jgi:hypothetical protein